MTEAEEVSAGLTRLSRQTGEQFDAVSAALPLSALDLSLWSNQCLHIAGSGWHAFESTNAFLQLTPSLLAKGGVARLHACGELGVSLCGYSFEPSRAYFAAALSIVQLPDPFPLLERVEATGMALNRIFPGASNLMADFFNTARFLVAQQPGNHVVAWCDLVSSFAQLSRTEVTELLNLSRDRIPFPLAARLAGQSTDAAIAYIRHYPALNRNLGAATLSAFSNLFVHFASLGEGLEPLFASLTETRRDLAADRELRDCLYLFADARLAACVVTAAENLPFDQPVALRAWIEAGLCLDNPDARLAFFSLESVSSVQRLETVRGQVNFIDSKRVLQMYAEAMSGRRIRIDSDPECDQPAPVRSDGVTIELPEFVARYGDARRNFSFYRIAVLHQLGYHEFGFYQAVRAIQWAMHGYADVPLAKMLLGLLEAARVDWQIVQRYRGIRDEMAFFKSKALSDRTGDPDLPELLVRMSLHDIDALSGLKIEMAALLRPLAQIGASPADSLAILPGIYELVREHGPVTAPRPVDYRGVMDLTAALDHALLQIVEENLPESQADELMNLLSQFDPDNAEIEELRKGEVDPALGKLVTELDNNIPFGDDDEDRDEEVMSALSAMAGRVSKLAREDRRFYYDEWDYVIDDYRRRWCTLKEIRDIEEQPAYVAETLGKHRDISKKVRKQLNMLKPELLRKVKGVVDGDEMDLERAVESLVDRKSGVTPLDNIYIQRQRKDRDVSTLFLLDMSASTDDLIPDPDAPPVVYDEDDDDYLRGYWQRKETEAQGERIIDLEKKAVILMADALSELGDNYSVCGFSGYGRDQVEYYLCKDFSDAYDLRARGRIGGIKPCRSTRMGPAIRHATRSLVKTESRIKALIIISDGYPQDFDYGKDRSSKEYGVKDTMKALFEARQQGVQSFCLTVDQSGHDYLREMCPDKQYMVIQDIKELPSELSKVYRSLTG